MENDPNKKIEKSAVEEMIRARGLEDAETMEMVNKWMDERRSELGPASKTDIIVAFEQADLYLAAGDTAGALETLEQARQAAFYEQEEELLQQINQKMDAIEGK